MSLILALSLFALTVPLDTIDAYLDADARRTVQLARAHTKEAEQSIRRYDVRVAEQVSFSARMAGRERLIFREELAAQIRWRHDGPGEAKLLGGREINVAEPEAQLSTGYESRVAGMAFDPAGKTFFDRVFGLTGEMRSPLAPGSEAHYRFRSGDTISVRLADGTRLRLVELQLLPRRAEKESLVGSLWLDEQSHGFVQARVRPAGVWKFEFGVERRSGGGAHGSIGGKIELITVDYAQWENRWWLPHRFAIHATAELGSFLGGVARMERSYGAYEVEGAPQPLPFMESEKKCSKGETTCVCGGGRCGWTVVLAGDSTSMVDSPELPSSAYSAEAMLSEAELRETLAHVDGLVRVLRRMHGPTYDVRAVGPDLIRYNRVEGLSLGAQVNATLVDHSADLTLRLGAADLRPVVELGVRRATESIRYRVAAYHRLAEMDARVRAFGIGNSLSSLVLGRDDGDYFRAYGAELVGKPRSPGGSYEWRLFAERQSEASRETDWSFARLAGGDPFRPNRGSEAATQAGASLRLRTSRGLDPTSFRWGGEVGVEAATGTFSFARPEARLWSGVPLPGPLTGHLEVEAGTSVGELPLQSHYLLGGPATLRGYGGGTLAGESYWRARTEVATALPGARLALFGDLGWAGPRERWATGAPLSSAGVGASFFDGLLRLDLARGLGEEGGWRMDLYLNGGL